MIGDKLVELRKSKNKTQAEMAKILGVVKGTYSSYEQNRRTPDNETQIKIADYFDITLDELNGRERKEYTYNLDDLDVLMFQDKEGFDELTPDEKQELWDQMNDQLEFLIERKKKKK